MDCFYSCKVTSEESEEALEWEIRSAPPVTGKSFISGAFKCLLSVIRTNAVHPFFFPKWGKEKALNRNFTK